MRLRLATHNAGKVREIKKNLPQFEILPEDSAAEETAATFVGNALLKAEALAAKYKGDWILADDSGLQVVALNGEPGVRSARYAGKDGDTPANNKLLLENMSKVEDRRASFVCAMALIEPTGAIHTVEGRCHGVILSQPAGNGGFGYDPLFVPDGHERTFAELSEDEKNAISHRARALAQVVKIIEGQVR